MILYNVTVKVDNDIHEAWLNWLKKEHIADVLGTKKFIEAKVYKILVDDETDGITYSIQYFAASMEDYFDYIHLHANEMRKKGNALWEGKFVAFRTVLKEI